MATPSPYPPPGYDTPRPERRHLSYPQFLARAVTIAALAPFVLGALAVVSLLPLILLAVAVGSGGPATSSDERVGATSHVAGTDGASAMVLAVPVEGPILTGEAGGGLFGGGSTSGYETKRLLLRAARDPDVRAVVLEMNTPGGTIAGSAAIADGVAALKAAGKPVIAHVSDLSASGGVWAMAPADTIIVDPGALVGSIGVILGPLRQYKGVTAIDDGFLSGGVEVDPTKGSIDEVVITAGTSKDLGNPYRPLTAAERASLQTAVDSSYGLFVDHVAKNRPQLSAERIRSEVGALIYAAADAVRIGLVDKTGSADDAYAAAAAAAGLTRWDVRRPDSGGFFDSLFGVRLPWTERATAPPDLSSLCGPRLVPLAFSGDLNAVCGARR